MLSTCKNIFLIFAYHTCNSLKDIHLLYVIQIIYRKNHFNKRKIRFLFTSKEKKSYKDYLKIEGDIPVTYDTEYLS